MMKKLMILLGLLLLAGCSSADQNSFQQMSMTEAAEVMENEDSVIVADVRTAEEYAAGHIPGAVSLPVDSLAENAQALLPNLDQQILVYCRSGSRSRKAAGILADLGYTNVTDIGGISSWDGEIVTGTQP